MNSLTANIDPHFDQAYPAMCGRMGCNPLHLLAVMFSEANGADPAAHNPHGDASGLIQFMPDTLRGLGWHSDAQAFRCLPASGQLPYVEAYYRPWAKDAASGRELGPRDLVWGSPGRLYQATFLPGTLRTARNPEDIIAAHNGVLGWAFDANSAFDENGDKTIRLQELSDAASNAVARYAARWLELTERIGLKEEGAAFLTQVRARATGNMTSALDIQQALNKISAKGFFDLAMPLAEDGIAGPATTDAIRAFQTAAGLLSDGKAGPKTRAAMSSLAPHD